MSKLNKLRVLSLFSGIGAFEAALERQGVEHEVVGFSEIDKYAIESYCAIHNVDKNKCLGDVSEVNMDDIPGCDLITYGFPCQSYSVAGKQLGVDDPRGVLFYDALRVIRSKKPKYAIAENVKGLVGKKFKDVFEDMLAELDLAGYNTYWKVLNAKDYGVPQNRERVFMVSIRKDIDKGFEFPKEFKDKGVRLRDILTSNAEERYYIDDEKAKNLIDSIDVKSLTMNTNDINQVGMLDIKGNEQIRRVYGANGLAPTLNTMQGGNRQPKVIIDDTQGFDGVRVYKDISPTLRSSRSGLKTVDDYRVRKLTPLECWKLQGFTEKCHNKAKAALEDKFYKGADRSNSQMYKQAGNSIAVPVLEYIFKNLLK